MTGASITTGTLTTEQAGAVLALADAAAAADHIAPLSEHVLLHLRYDASAPSSQRRDFLVTVNGQVAGYAYLDLPEPSGELVIHPARRRQGLGRALAGELAVQARGHTLRLWAHGDLAAAAGLAASAGFHRIRALWQMRRPLRDLPDRPGLPAGITLRTFAPGRDEDEWLSLNGRAFARHPEQGAWTRRDLELREREPWFDPAGFFIAERHGVMAGFHWTKVHPPEGGDGPLGEVYVVGVDPGERGTGLGRALTLAGLHHLRGLGLDQVMLYVDEDNAPAIRMYTALGFTRVRTDAMYAKPAKSPMANTAGLAVTDSQRLVEFRRSQRPVGGRHRG
jgi:mycothiol synthase